MPSRRQFRRGDHPADRRDPMAKRFASDNTMKKTIEAVQCRGGLGTVND
jgi:alkylation response protein AidB-like acyl-CoA dehydrogenase